MDKIILGVVLVIVTIISFIGWHRKTVNIINYDGKNWHSYSGSSFECRGLECEENIVLRRSVSISELCNSTKSSGGR